MGVIFWIKIDTAFQEETSNKINKNSIILSGYRNFTDELLNNLFLIRINSSLKARMSMDMLFLYMRNITRKRILLSNHYDYAI